MQVIPLGEGKARHGRLCLLLIAPPRLGKSWLLATAPKPMLVADCGGGVHSIPRAPGVTIDGVTYSDDGIDVVYPQGWQDLLAFYTSTWRQKPSPQAQKHGERYRTVALDHITECNFHIILNEVAPNKDIVTKQDWGIIGKNIKVLARKAAELADVARYPEGPHVVVTALRKDVELETDTGGSTGRIGPLLSGQCFDDVPGVFDLVAYMLVRARLGKDGKPVRKRMLQTETDGVYVCGSRYPGLSMYEEPDLTKLWAKVEAARAAEPRAAIVKGGADEAK